VKADQTAQPDKKNGHKPPEPAPALDLAQEFAPPAAALSGPLGVAGDGTLASQAARLGDPRLHVVQRQVMAAQIGQVQGNRHLQTVIAFRRVNGNGHGPAPATARPPAPAEAPAAEQTEAGDDGLGVSGPPTAAAASEPPPAPPGPAASATVQRRAAGADRGPAAPSGLPDQNHVQRGLFDAIANPRQAALGALANFARNVPGYHLLTLVLGRDPITDQTVERTPKTVFQAVLSLVPGGNLIFQNLDESGAIDKAFAWLDEQFAQLGLGWEAIKDLFRRAWEALSITDLLNPFGAWEKLKAIFLGPINRIKNFVVSIGQKVMEFIFEGVLEKLGGGQVLALLKRAGSAFMLIVKDPIGFLGNLINGVKQGLLGFVSNIGMHLKKGLMTWLFGELAQTGIQLPETFDLKGILTLVLQVLGLTWQAIRAQAVKLLGERVVGVLEGAFSIFKIIMEQGLGGLWEYIKEQLGNLKEMVLDGIKDMVITQVIQAGIQWLLSMLGGPAGAVIKAIKMIYDVVMWFVNNGSRVMALVNAIVDSLGAIAGGTVDVAARFVEQALAKTVPVVIGFLASLLGLGNLGARIKAIIQKIQEPIQKAIGWVLGKARAFAQKVMGRLGFGARKAPGTPEEGASAAVKARAGREVSARLKGPIRTAADVRPVITSVYNQLRPEGLKSLQVVEDARQPGHFKVMASASETEPVADLSTELGIEVGDILPLVGGSGWGKTSLSAYMLVGDRPVNFGKHENTPEEEEKVERHAEVQLLRELRGEWSGVARKGRPHQLVVEITRSPCANCSLQLREFVEEKRAQGYDLTLTVRTLSIYGGTRRDEAGAAAPRYEGTRLVLEAFNKPGMKLEPWDVFAELKERGLHLDPKVITPTQQQTLKRRIDEVKAIVGQIADVKAGG